MIKSMEDYYKIYFANGGDRTEENVPELDVCKELDVVMLWGVGGGKIQSSSWLTGRSHDPNKHGEQYESVSYTHLTLPTSDLV